MPRARLTVLNIRQLPAKDGKRTDYWDALLPGFLLRVTPAGVRTYAIARKHEGKKRRWNIGDAKKVDLARARELARTFDRLEAGLEPEGPAAADGAFTTAKMVGHTVSGPRVSRLYNRAERLPERRSAVEAWARWLEALPGPGAATERSHILKFKR